MNDDEHTRFTHWFTRDAASCGDVSACGARDDFGAVDDQLTEIRTIQVEPVRVPAPSVYMY